MGSTLFKGQVEPSTNTTPELVKNANEKNQEGISKITISF